MEVITMRTQAAPLLTRLAWLVHRFRPDGNPLRRTADRAETAVLAGLLTAFLAGAPFVSLGADHWAAAAGRHTERVQATWHRVPAVLLQDAPGSADAMFADSLEPQVRARWTAPDGSARFGRVPAGGGGRAGTTVMVWADSSGRVTGVPVQHAVLADEAVQAAVLASAALALLLLAAGRLARRGLDRQRLAAWQADWSATGPQWSSQR
jgi:hypothetical protein